MKKYNTEHALGIIADKINSLENLVQKNTQLLKESLNIEKEHQFIINNGITGLKNKILNEYKLSKKSCPREKAYSIIRQDKILKYPHKKILNYLIEQYDYQKNKFIEIYFSQIVKGCRIGKNKANEYFEFLIKKGYLKKRNDGYRVWYCIDIRVIKGDLELMTK